MRTSASVTQGRWPATHPPPCWRRFAVGPSRRAASRPCFPPKTPPLPAESSRRFGLPLWSFTLTATDANRWAIRIARQVTRRPKILVFNFCYHGSVDETFATLDGGVVRAREGNIGPPVDPAVTTRVVEFNDVDALEREPAKGDVAVVLAEPALTNIGIVLPEPGFNDALRQLTRDAGTLLLIDETHTFSAGPSGATGAWGLEPDLLTLGKAIAGGIPAGAYGLSASVAERIAGDGEADLIDVGGIGGTLAGNALSTAAVRATLADVLTEEAFADMTSLTERYVAAVNEEPRGYRPCLECDQVGGTSRVPLLLAGTPERRRVSRCRGRGP